MQFQKYLRVTILLIVFSVISVNAKRENTNEICDCTADQCENHCEYKSFIKNKKNKTGCICKPGFARSNNGKCIPTHNCASECGHNEIFVAGSDSGLIPCDYVCKCKKGYYRKKKNCVPCRYPQESMKHCVEFDENKCSCNKCDDTSILCEGICRQKKCTNSCKQSEVRDENTCACHPCLDGQIACKGTCVNYPKYCTMFHVDRCECLKCENGYVLENGNCVPEPQIICPPYESYYCGNKCPSTCSQQNNNDICDEECRCVCAHGLVRNETWQCVHPSECICKPNANYGKYDSTCIATCENPYPENCASVIKVGCTCMSDYVLNTKLDECVRYEDCPLPVCLQNEEYLACGSACPPTCDIPEPMSCTKQCVSGCFCKKDYYRDLNDFQCVKKKNCSCSFKNTQFCLCGPKEQATCKNPFVYNDDVCYEDRPGCYCVQDTIRDMQTGKCVKPKNCSCNRQHEEYTTCGSACERSCSEPEPKLCMASCVPGCFCKDGYIRDEFGECILPHECRCPPNEIASDQGCICRPGYIRQPYTGECIEEHVCPCPNEEYHDCGTHCPLTCDDMNPRPCIESCNPGCFCNNETIRDGNTGLCVKPEECCNSRINEAYFSCYLEHPKGNCKRGCYCINDTVRDESGICVPKNSSESCDS